MIFFKRIFARILKFISDLLPTSFRMLLRNNGAIFKFYSSVLTQSKLFYGEPTLKQVNSRYKHIFDKQQISINTLPDNQLLIFDFGSACTNR